MSDLDPARDRKLCDVMLSGQPLPFLLRSELDAHDDPHFYALHIALDYIAEVERLRREKTALLQSLIEKHAPDFQAIYANREHDLVTIAELRAENAKLREDRRKLWRWMALSTNDADNAELARIAREIEEEEQ